MSVSLNLSHITIEYDTMTGPVLEDLSVNFSLGWTGLAGANGSGKSSLLNLISGRLSKDEFTGDIHSIGCVVICEQEVEMPPSDAEIFLSSFEQHALRLQRNLKIDISMPERWSELSMGERKKIQIGTALFKEPDILCIDEPTNHLDSLAREELSRVLNAFHGIGILVSHDRALLDSLCSQTLFLRGKGSILRAGGITRGLEEEENELKRERSTLEELKRDLRKNKRELQRRKEKAQKAENKDSKRKLAKKDFDGKGKIDAARVSGRDRHVNDLLGMQAKITSRKREQLEAFEITKIQKTGLNIPYGVYSSRNRILEFPETVIELGPERKLKVPKLEIAPDDRIALTGLNGTGKSTLLKHLIDKLNIHEEEILYLPQEIGFELREEINTALTHLSKEEFSRVMSIVASLGSSPERVMTSERYSPGELRKLFIALGVLRRISLIILDEPTNHMDLPSIRCMEAAFKDCNAALLLISHDMIFLKSLCSVHWEISSVSPLENHLTKKYF